MQTERRDFKKWDTGLKLVATLDEYIDTFHNGNRGHPSLDMLTPTEYPKLPPNATTNVSPARKWGQVTATVQLSNFGRKCKLAINVIASMGRKVRSWMGRLQQRIVSLDDRTYFRLPRVLSRRLLQDVPGKPWTSTYLLNLLRSGGGLQRGRFVLTKPDKIVSRVYGNFGNQIIETALAVMAAKSVEVGHVVLRESGVFSPCPFIAEGVRVIPPEKPISYPGYEELLNTRRWHHPPSTILEGAFLLNWLSEPYELDLAELAAVYQGLVQGLEGQLSEDPLPDSELVVSFRGGDVFSENPPHHYGQPPLSYYTLATSTSFWSHIWVVSDDESNPIMSSYLDWLSQTNYTWTWLRQTWKRDFSLLYRATNIVAPRSTFIPAIGAISPNVKKIFFMEDVNLPVPTEKYRIVHDTCGEYRNTILSNDWLTGKWKRLPSQVKLMEEYPEHCLQIEAP